MTKDMSLILLILNKILGDVMKWNIESPNAGDIKIKRKFAFFPIRIGYEVRWLEFVNIKYRYYASFYNAKLGGYMYDVWIKERFIE